MIIRRSLTLRGAQGRSIFQRAETRLLRTGYHPVPGFENRYRRGTRLGDIISADPRRSHAEVSLEIEERDDAAELRCTWQLQRESYLMSTPQARHWYAELDAFCDEVRDGRPQPADGTWARRAGVMRAQVAIVTVVLLLALLWLVWWLTANAVTAVILTGPLLSVSYILANSRSRRGIPDLNVLSRGAFPANAYRPGALAAPAQGPDDAHHDDLAWQELDDFDRRLQDAQVSQEVESAQKR